MAKKIPNVKVIHPLAGGESFMTIRDLGVEGTKVVVPMTVALALRDFCRKAFLSDRPSMPTSIDSGHCFRIYDAVIKAGAYVELDGADFEWLMRIWPERAIQAFGMDCKFIEAYLVPLAEEKVEKTEKK